MLGILSCQPTPPLTYAQSHQLCFLLLSLQCVLCSGLWGQSFILSWHSFPLQFRLQPITQHGTSWSLCHVSLKFSMACSHVMLLLTASVHHFRVPLDRRPKASTSSSQPIGMPGTWVVQPLLVTLALAVKRTRQRSNEQTNGQSGSHHHDVCHVYSQTYNTSHMDHLMFFFFLIATFEKKKKKP